jgi:hypothetical protein
MAKLGSTVDARLSRISPYAIRAIEMGGHAMGAAYASIGESAAKAITSYAEMKETEEKEDNAVTSLTDLFKEGGYDDDRAESSAKEYISIYGAAPGLTAGRSFIENKRLGELEEDWKLKNYELNVSKQLFDQGMKAFDSVVASEKQQAELEENLRKLNPESLEYQKLSTELDAMKLEIGAFRRKQAKFQQNADSFKSGAEAISYLRKYNLTQDQRIQYTQQWRDAFTDYDGTHETDPSKTMTLQQLLFSWNEGYIPERVYRTRGDKESKSTPFFQEELIEEFVQTPREKKQKTGRSSRTGQTSGTEGRVSLRDDFSKLVEGVGRAAFRPGVKELRDLNKGNLPPEEALRNLTPEQFEKLKKDIGGLSGHIIKKFTDEFPEAVSNDDIKDSIYDYIAGARQ